jgi:hypothetical protein
MVVTKRIRRAENVADMEEKIKACWILVRRSDGKNHFEDLGVARDIKSGS